MTVNGIIRSFMKFYMKMMISSSFSFLRNVNVCGMAIVSDCKLKFKKYDLIIIALQQYKRF